MLNKVTLIGNLGRDPEVRHTQDGKPVVNMSLATSKRWRDKNSGEQRERTEWHRIVCWNESLGKIIQQYLVKGSKVYIEGEIQTRKWTDQQGVEKYTTEIVMQGFDAKLVMLSEKRERREDPPDERAADEPDYEEASGRVADEDLDSEIPF